MNFAKRFCHKFVASIVSLLGCFDRVIFKGYLPFGDDDHLNAFVDGVLQMRRKDFLPWLERHSQTLVEYAQEMARRLRRPYEYRQGKFEKEKFIRDLIATERLVAGLVAGLCVQETCRTVKLRHAAGTPRLFFARRPQRVLYYYWLDEQFGLVHLRLQTWFPYSMQVYVNGHDWLARQMTARRLGFVQHDNAFVARRQRDGRWQKVWCPMNQGVANLPSYQRVARGANDRYLDALSVVADPTAAYREVATLANSKQSGGRRYAGFNPARREDIRLFQAVLSGDHLLRGFRNAGVRVALWGESRDAAERRRQAARVTRLLQRLHVRGLLARIPHTRRWRVSASSQQVLTKLVRLHYHGLPQAA